MSDRYVVDRVEGDTAVLENIDNLEILNVNSKLIKDVHEGDVVIFNGSTYEIDVNETKKRKEEMKKMMDSMWE